MSGKSDTRIYIGNLPQDIRTQDIEDLFYKYGKIKFIDLKNRKGPPFAFVEYEDPRDAEDAVKARDCYNYEGYKLRVEFQKGGRGEPRSFMGSGGGGRGNNAPPRRSDNRIIISGLPPTGSWQDVKDHMREAGTVCYADVFKDGTGVVEFIHYDDMKYAIKNLDDTKFRSHEGETSYIRIKQDTNSRGGDRRRSNSLARSRSRSVSKRRERGSPTYSPERRQSRSRSRSRSNSKGSDYNRNKHKSVRRRHSRSYSRSKSRSPVRRASSRSRSRSASVKRRRYSRSQTKSRSRSRSLSNKEELAAEENQQN